MADNGRDDVEIVEGDVTDERAHAALVLAQIALEELQILNLEGGVIAHGGADPLPHGVVAGEDHPDQVGDLAAGGEVARHVEGLQLGDERADELVEFPLDAVVPLLGQVALGLDQRPAQAAGELLVQDGVVVFPVEAQAELDGLLEGDLEEEVAERLVGEADDHVLLEGDPRVGLVEHALPVVADLGEERAQGAQQRGESGPGVVIVRVEPEAHHGQLLVADVVDLLPVHRVVELFERRQAAGGGDGVAEERLIVQVLHQGGEVDDVLDDGDIHLVAVFLQMVDLVDPRQDTALQDLHPGLFHTIGQSSQI